MGDILDEICGEPVYDMSQARVSEGSGEEDIWKGMRSCGLGMRSYGLVWEWLMVFCTQLRTVVGQKSVDSTDLTLVKV